MQGYSRRIVIDSNVLVRAAIQVESAAGEVLSLCEQRRVLILLSKPVLSEYRFILNHPDLLSRYPTLEERRVNITLERLAFVGDVIRSSRVRFEYPRDPKDAKFVELAIAGNATHLVTLDRDLLDLPEGHNDAAKRFRQRLPHIAVITPGQFLASVAEEQDA